MNISIFNKNPLNYSKLVYLLLHSIFQQLPDLSQLVKSIVRYFGFKFGKSYELPFFDQLKVLEKEV